MEYVNLSKYIEDAYTYALKKGKISRFSSLGIVGTDKRIKENIKYYSKSSRDVEYKDAISSLKSFCSYHIKYPMDAIYISSILKDWDIILSSEYLLGNVIKNNEDNRHYSPNYFINSLSDGLNFGYIDKNSFNSSINKWEGETGISLKKFRYTSLSSLDVKEYNIDRENLSVRDNFEVLYAMNNITSEDSLINWVRTRFNINNLQSKCFISGIKDSIKNIYEYSKDTALDSIHLVQEIRSLLNINYRRTGFISSFSDYYKLSTEDILAKYPKEKIQKNFNELYSILESKITSSVYNKDLLNFVKI